MAGGALSALGALRELPIVRIGLVAVHAFLERERPFEVSVGVALGAIDAGVLAFERKLRLGVIETLVDSLEGKFLPPARVVARLAALREAAMMRVLVTVGALVERNTHILRLAVRPIGVALGALDLGMQASQGIAGLRVVKLRLTGLADIDRLPVHKIVALQAVRSEAAFVLIFVAANATRRQTKIGSTRILDFDRRAFLGGDVGGVMAFVACQTSVPAFEQVSRFFVIERLYVPFDQREIFAIVFRVTARALLAGTGRNVVGCMQSLAAVEPHSDFGVAIQALERSLSTELVATGAVGWSVE